MKGLKRKLKNLLHFVEAFVFAAFYGFPARKLRVIGVTGTDGKTTTTTLIYQGLKKAGKRVSMISSVYAKIGDKIYETGLHTTTPAARDLQRYLYLAAKNGEKYMVLEVTAHGLDQHRVDFINFDIGVLTNITPEHILSKDKEADYFGSFEKYMAAKLKLLLRSKKVVVNKDAEVYPELKKTLEGKEVYTYGKTKADFTLDLNDLKKIKKHPLPDFLKENFLAAYAALKLLGVENKVIFKALSEFKLPPGRLEVVYSKDFTVIIDFAHTINSFRKVLPFIKKTYVKKGGRLIHVFGVAGERDFTKRKAMGEASGEAADVVILTEEDYRTEDPVKIAQEVAAGLIEKGFKEAKKMSEIERKGKFYHIEVDRFRALEKAVSLAKKGDVVLATGKGHEKSLARGKKEYPWGEKEAILKILKKLQYV